MKRSKFSLSHHRLLSCDMGELVPIGLFEVLPGDTIQQATSVLIRCSPLLAPVMHPVTVRIHHWFVPHRLVWDEFEDFITGGPDGMNASVAPRRNWPAGGFDIGTLGDYLGIPTGPIPNASNVSVLPFRGYALIWNEHYRDQDLQSELVISKASGADNTTSIALQHCAWEKDYFTSSRPWEQKGPTITIPIGTSAPVLGLGWPTPETPSNSTPVTAKETSRNVTYPVSGAFSSTNLWTETTGAGSSAKPNIRADLASASAVTVNILREALALQRFEEARARYGSRYTEYLRYLGVRSSDARLQRPEYLGGGKQVIQFSEVLQTAEGTSPVGEMRGHGLSAMRSNRYRRFFEEHGFVFSLLSVRPKTIYMQGLPRHWSRDAKELYFQKELQHIGQQEILNREVYGAHTEPTGVFGFQDRYDEYRRQESGVSGEFRSTLLNYWHLAREFATPPALNADFIQCKPTERIFAVPSQDVLWCMARHSIQARRLVASRGSSFTF